MSSLCGDAVVGVSGSAQSLSVRAWFRCVLQQYLYKNADGSDSRTGTVDKYIYVVLTQEGNYANEGSTSM